ncbi:MAG: phosphoribosyltransferase family protein [Candidatus Dojkabacteria bacterium]|nr:phosphoribosyltransferase family protein [Candidatus Dojkabacteria bacterium]
MKNIFSSLVDFLFPKKCVACGLYRSDFLCNTCRSTLKKYKPECYVSRKPSSNWVIKKRYKSKTNLEKAFYFYHYNSILFKLISYAKFAKYINLIDVLFELLIDADEFHKINFDFIDLITSVPVSKTRLAERGFNHAEILATNIARYVKKPYKFLCEKIIDTKDQIELSREERLKNLKDAFVCISEIDLNNLNILIVDDVITTGTTVENVAESILKKYPLAKIYALSIARGD